MTIISRRSLFSGLLSSVAVVVLLTGTVSGQTTAARPDRGFMPGASYSVSDVENISLTNGNVNLTLPLASLPPIAGGKLKLTLSAVYNSKQWNVTRKEYQGGTFTGCPTWVVDTPQVSDVGGWKIAAGGYGILFREVRDDFDYAIPDTVPGGEGGSCESDYQEYQRILNTWRRVVLIGPDGAEHELRPTDGYYPYGGNARSYLFNYYKDTPDTINAPIRYYSFDGSFLYAVVNPSSYATRWTIYLNDGTRVVQLSNGIQRIIDTNGNSIKIYSDTNGAHYQDEQTGREIRYTYDAAANNNKGQGQVHYQTVGGGWQTIDINFDVTRVQGKVYRVDDWRTTGGETGGGMACFHDNVLQSDIQVIRDIIFPATELDHEARRYSFGYNSDTTDTATNTVLWACGMGSETYTRTVSSGMGGLNRMDTPSGSSVAYAYSKDGRHTFSPLGETDDIPRETVTKKELTHDGVTDTWDYNIYEFGACGGTVKAPDGSETIESCYPHDSGAGSYNASLPKGGLTFRTNQANKQISEKHWTMLAFTGGNAGATGNFGQSNFNPVVDTEYVTLLDNTTSHAPVKTSAKTYQYDYNGNLIQETDYDWFDSSLVNRDSGGEPTGVPASATVLRVVNNTYHNGSTSPSSANVYAKRVLSTATPLILGALQQTTLGSSVTQLSYDGQAYAVAPTVGNVTSQSVWDDLDNKWITSSQTYGSYGNLASKTDARGKVTQFFYDDLTHASPNRVVVDPQNGTGTQTLSTAFDFSTGLVTSETDANNNTTTIDYTNQLLGTIDPFGRPGATIGPLTSSGGVNQQHRTRTEYKPSERMVTVFSDLNTEGDALLKSQTISDELGRVTESRQFESAGTFIAVRKTYDTLNRLSRTSNPFRTGETLVWTTSLTDELGRIVSVTTPDGAVVQTAYDANKVTVTDQKLNKRQSVSDALGRLVQVIEDPGASGHLNYSTTYDYDVFGNLTGVSQGTQTRTFTYDSLSRLRTAINPESGTITYTYDDNGNLLTKQDARGIVSTYVYDALDRATNRSYSDGTPAVTYAYDTGIANAKGKLISVSSSVSAFSYTGYDAMGRANGGTQTIGSQNYVLAYTYDLSGHVKTMTYPSGHTVTYNFDRAGRLGDKDSQNLAFTGTLGDGVARTYSSEVNYSPAGGLSKERFGTTTAVYNKLFYNIRGQLAEIRESTSYTGPTDTTWDRGAIINHYSNDSGCSGASCSASDNNGNLMRQEIKIPNSDTFNQFYEYDSLNRLQSARENKNGGATNWRQAYYYDRYGNRRIDNNTSQTYGGVNNLDFELETGTNRLYAPGDLALSDASRRMRYDSAGNLIKDAYSGAGERLYDAENRMKKAWGNNQWQEYGYDGDGRRVKRIVDGTETWQVYGLNGELLAEYAANGSSSNPQKEYGYRNGHLLITATVTAGWGSAPTLNDNPLVINQTTIQARHITELRDAINALRAHLGMAAYTWQYSATTNDWISANPILEMRTALDQALGAPSGGYSAGLAQYQEIKKTHIQELRDRVLAAWTNGSSTEIFWLVTDQLGTPRMMFDQTGSLATMKRHDYLPFGEELGANSSIRTQPGYAADSVRQKFTSYERDDETGLDYARNRFYSSLQGRFTAVDPALQSINGINPQSLNRYAYVLGNPLNFVDPLGLWVISYTEIWENDKYVRTVVTITKSQKDDNAESLLKQLGFDSKSDDGKKLLGEITAQLKTGEVVDPKALSGIVGRTFKAFEAGISRQVKYEVEHGYKNTKQQGPNNGFNEEYADCSMTACRVAMPNDMRNLSGMYVFGVQQADDMLARLSAPKDGTRVGDVVRYGKDELRHFANILFKDDDGVTQIFSRTGTSGRFENLRVDDRNLTQKYGPLNKTFRPPFGP
jgi:RHS repeat-associated protein